MAETTTQAAGREWWRDAVIYQIYPRSFQDENGDGIGDLPGITRRLDHVAGLGVDAIWLSPFFRSPDRDMGYDVSGYTEVSPLYGTIEDFDALVERAHALGLKVIIDQVLSHTSDQHPWFEESRASRDNPKADWYVWADPKEDGTPPNNWLSIFGGSAWQFDTRRRQYYLHNFAVQQPDINFHCRAAVDALLETMEFWLKRGVDGFRLDTANFYVHDAKLRDNPPAPRESFPTNPYEAQDQVHSKTQPENLDILRRFRGLTDRYDDRMMVGEVGEMGMRQVEIMGEYTEGRDKLHMAYSFAMLSHDKSAAHFRDTISAFQTYAPHGWPCWSFSNHDVTRHVSRWTPGGRTHSEDRATADAVARQSIAMLVSFPGTLGIYQGEELGQVETDIAFDELQDTANIDFWPDYKGRDGCRTPMVWEAEAPNAGFSTGTPWLPVKAPQAARAVDRQGNDGVMAAYRAALAWRKQRDELRLGGTSFPDVPEPVLAVARSHAGRCLTGVFNLGPDPVTLSVDGASGTAGPVAGEWSGSAAGNRLVLPGWGYAYLEGAAPPDLQAE
ncbi:alpha-amylase family glycosyl hydrolase [Wenxinia saemankumensis]|uniref:Alpha-glucosidase n=1 Tax=Wenxinia saemankumensis TaxID=1447782 RepID=A0A1M6CBL5_9RHOB|nr:alpha-amylase family glycosyl hydrolase [Wenxinia saemankumensis]SHI58425.1 alpha-glucosidase [Wenxinia saemankumensis]